MHKEITGFDQRRTVRVTTSSRFRHIGDREETCFDRREDGNEPLGHEQKLFLLCRYRVRGMLCHAVANLC